MSFLTWPDFALGHVQDGLDGLGLGGVDEAAGVHDDGVGLLRRDQLEPRGPGLAEHPLAIYPVLGAPELDQRDPHATSASPTR